MTLMAKGSFARWVGRRAKNIKEKIRYMRIKKIGTLKAKTVHKSEIPPAEWQKFIEI